MRSHTLRSQEKLQQGCPTKEITCVKNRPIDNVVYVDAE
jgi:hypothetical protein